MKEPPAIKFQEEIDALQDCKRVLQKEANKLKDASERLAQTFHSEATLAICSTLTSFAHAQWDLDDCIKALTKAGGLQRP